jgi:hypothetical protein
MRVIPLLFLAIGLAGCEKEGGAIQLEGTAYYFPAQHVSGIVKPEDSGSGQYYIRLIPPGGYYWLVYDPFHASLPNKQGPNIPTIPHINDIRFWKGKEVPSEVGPLLCKTQPANDHSAYMPEIFTCGFRITDAGVSWSVIIPGDLAASAPALKRRAELTLADYRNDSRLKKHQ